MVTGFTGGVTYLATGKTISICGSGFSNNYLTLKNFYQQGSTAQTLTLTGSAILNLINANFEGNLTVTSPGILLKNSTFYGTTSITRNGSSGSFHCDGGEGTYLSIGMMGFELTPSIPSLRLQTATIPQTIPEPILNTIQIYPNPTGDNFNVRSLHLQIKKVEIYNAQSKLLKLTELESTEIEFGMNYKPGIYGVRVYLQNGETKWFKLVKL